GPGGPAVVRGAAHGSRDPRRPARPGAAGAAARGEPEGAAAAPLADRSLIRRSSPCPARPSALGVRPGARRLAPARGPLGRAGAIGGAVGRATGPNRGVRADRRRAHRRAFRSSRPGDPARTPGPAPARPCAGRRTAPPPCAAPPRFPFANPRSRALSIEPDTPARRQAPPGGPDAPGHRAEPVPAAERPDPAPAAARAADRAAPPGGSRTALRALLLRLHFYAGVLVAPFLVVAAATGLLYTFTPQLEQAVYADRLHVGVGTDRLPLRDQVAAATAAYPEGTLDAVRPGHAPADSTPEPFTQPAD